VVEEPSDERRRQRPKHWGLRTLGFLGIALASLLTSSYGGGKYILLSDLGVLVGLIGAAYCSYRGAKDVTWLPR
jgi:peptidoglycan/LPS O-acetylase OafA/YrhL